MEKSYLEMVQIKKPNKIDGLHPKTKAFILLLYIICTFVISTIKVTRFEIPLYLIPWFGVLLILFAISGQFMKCIKGCKLVFTVFLIIFIVQSLIIPGGEVLFRLGFITIEQEGIRKACSLGFMVLDVAGIFVWFFQTTSNKEIAAALNEAGVNETISYVFVSTLKMIDEMSKNSKVIMSAQRARGIETEGNLMVRAKAFVPSLVPLILTAVTGAEERVVTLEARGFSIKDEKTSVFKLQKSGLETLATVVALIITVAIVVWRFLG
ncbi:MAG: energy-coupling factor transporter transmembrane protein EcfT [Erysipelotrichaceae bacterium]|nr:energy-coupling factor transporter transmembrane protein EcfT [Erysipelotrichaceae bacterium]